MLTRTEAIRQEITAGRLRARALVNSKPVLGGATSPKSCSCTCWPQPGTEESQRVSGNSVWCWHVALEQECPWAVLGAESLRPDSLRDAPCTQELEVGVGSTHKGGARKYV